MCAVLSPCLQYILPGYIALLILISNGVGGFFSVLAAVYFLTVGQERLI